MHQHAERFMDAFRGSTLAHGETEIGRARKGGKQAATSNVVRRPMTLDDINDHLTGVMGKGSIPIDADSKCFFGVIDIDTYPLDIEAINTNCLGMKIPVTVCRSKSGGAHLYLFLKEKMDAALLREFLAEIAAALGHAGCEIFPKQEKILVERGDVGNFINLPYFDEENTTRYALGADNAPMDVAQFLDHVESTRVVEADLERMTFNTSRDIFPEGPPCLNTLCMNGVGQGMRNQVLLEAGNMYKRMDADNWKTLLERHNNQYNSPPLPVSEVMTIIKSLEKNDYQYSCKKSPLKDYCNAHVCRTRPFGIGKSIAFPNVSGLTVLLSDPRVWFLDVNGQRLELSTEQLQVQLQFQRACMDQISYMPPRMKEGDWTILINQLMSAATTIRIEEEYTTRGQLREHLIEYCTGRLIALDSSEISVGKAWPDPEDGFTYFRLDGLETYLEQRGFKEFKNKRGSLIARLSEMNAESSRVRYKDDNSRSHQVRCWRIPTFEKPEEVTLPRMETDNDIPF